METRHKVLPKPVVRRLTRYLTHVQTLIAKGVEWVSSDELAEALGLGSSTVRQDVTHLDFSGISKRGYETKGLASALVKVLGADNEVNAVIVGAGNLGRALARHSEFAKNGFVIRGIFDADADLVGRKFGTLTVKPMEDLPRVVREKHVSIGMIAVPAPSAQTVADHLIAAGVGGLLNLTTMHVLSPKDVAVVDARIVASLRELWYAIMTTRNKSRPVPAGAAKS